MIYTKYGSRVEILQSFKGAKGYGAFLVRARILTLGSASNPAIEHVGQTVLENDPFHNGYISNNELVADGGKAEVMQACMAAPEGVPVNTDTLLKLYWPQIFGGLELIGNTAQAGVTGGEVTQSAGVTNLRSPREIRIA